MKLKMALLAAAGAVALSSAAHAQQEEGSYVQLGAGMTFSSNSNDLESDTAYPVTFDGEYALDAGLSLYGASGWYLGQGFRTEVEFARRQQDVTAIIGQSPSGAGTYAGFPSNDSLGDITVQTLTVNSYKEFPLVDDSSISAYLGIGAGVAQLRGDFDNYDVALATPSTGVGSATFNKIFIDDIQYTAAYQAMAGMTFDFTDNMELDVRYRYLQTGDYEFEGVVNDAATGDLASNYIAHEVLAGLRWSFGGAAPIVPVTPQPQYKDCPDGSRVMVTASCPPIVAPTADPITVVDPLVVYFDYDKSNLTAAARDLIRASAMEALEGDLMAVNVEGHTDTSGSSAYNQALSARRANVVRDALISNGISGSLITVDALGESRPEVMTGDGVKEPLNRRTEVTFSY